MGEQQQWREVLDFWFPDGVGDSLEGFKQQAGWWMRGGADEAIRKRFSGLTAQAAAGEHDAWASDPQGRLALILVLDQFSRSVYRDSAKAYAQDAKACALACEAVDNGHYDALDAPWKKMFIQIAMGHYESDDALARYDSIAALADRLLEEAPPHLRQAFEFSAQQPRLARKVYAAFGRHPHRNALLGRESTPEEQAYLEEGKFPHQREVEF